MRCAIRLSFRIPQLWSCLRTGGGATPRVISKGSLFTHALPVFRVSDCPRIWTTSSILTSKVCIPEQAWLVISIFVLLKVSEMCFSDNSVCGVFFLTFVRSVLHRHVCTAATDGGISLPAVYDSSSQQMSTAACTHVLLSTSQHLWFGNLYQAQCGLA